MFQGSIVALVTPMTKTGELDITCLRKLVKLHLDQGTDAIVVNGTTGESPTTTNKEKLKVIETVLEVASGQIPVIAGTGTYSTMETIHRTEEAMKLGVDACILVTPYYNKPTQEGLYQHFKAVAEAVPIPQILYNVPGRTQCDLLPATVERLSHLSNIVGLKEATGDLARGRALKEICGDSFVLLSGDDPSALAFILQGGKGVISISSNVVPKKMHEMCKAALAGDFKRAGEINTPIMQLHKALIVEANPIPVKWVMHQMGLIEEGIRLPLTPLSEKNRSVVKEAMKEVGLL